MSVAPSGGHVPPATVVFVYFRAAPAARAAVEAALHALATQFDGVELALRDEPGAAWHTWLEHHRLPSGADVDEHLRRLAAAAARLGLDRLAEGGRHVEVFRTVSPRCA